MRKNIDHLVLSPKGNLLVTIDTDGRALLISVARRVVLHHMNFKGKTKSAKFSPDGKYFAVSLEKTVEFWKAPGHTREYAPFVRIKTAVGHHDTITNINWSPDSR
jgi:periodic tryptophan protein 2